MAYTPFTPFSEYLKTEQRKYPKINVADIEKLKEDLNDDKNLPPITDKQYITFLHSCYYNLELTKETIQKCFKYYFLDPQVFCQIDPLSTDTKLVYNSMSIGQIPCTNTDKSDRILYLELKDTSVVNYEALYKYLAMWFNYTLLMHGNSDGLIIVFNTNGLSWRHIIKLPIGLTSRLLKFLETGLPMRLKTIHLLNAGSAAQMLMKLIARVCNPELLERIKLHSPGSTDIFNYVPKSLMPLEVDGLGKSHIYISEELYKNLKEIRNFFLEQNEILNNQIMYINGHSNKDKD